MLLYTFLYIITFALFGFISMYFIYKPAVNKYMQTLELKVSSLAFPYIFAIYALCATVIYLTVNKDDFIEPLTAVRVFVPLILAAAIYASTLVFSKKVIYAVILFAVAITAFLQPIGIGNSFPLTQLWLRLLVFVFASVFCLGTRILNILPHTFIMPNIVILSGLILFAIIGAMPLYIAVCAAVLIGISAAYLNINYYDVKIDLDDGACVALSYLICNLLLLNLGEFCFPSCIIITLIFWEEMTAAVYNRLLITHLGMMSENTNYFFAAQKYPLQVLTAAIFKVGVILLFLSWFQLFSVNPYSLIIVGFLIVLWLNGALGQHENTPSKLVDINRKFVSDVKQNLQEVKEIFNTERKGKK